MEIVKDKKMIKVTFTDTYDLAQHIKSNPFDNARSKMDRDSEFCKYSWTETLDALERGWVESDKLKVNADTITSMGLHNAPDVRFDVTGDFLDVGSYLNGVPECWGNVVEEPKAMKKINVFVDLSVSCAVDAKRIENRGSAIMALIDSLRGSGHYVTITLAMQTKNCPKIKTPFQFQMQFETNNSYSRDALAFAVAHPGMIRRAFLSVLEIHAKHHALDGYGQPKASDTKDHDIVFGLIESDDFGSWETLKDASNRISKLIEERG